MELGPLITIAVIWAVTSIFGKIAKTAKQQQERQRANLPSRDRPVSVQQLPARRQAQTFEELLAEMRGEVGRQETPAPIWESASNEDEDIEDRRTSEEAPEVVSLETDWQRPQRVETFSDADEAQLLIKRRIDAAAARDHRWRMSDHEAFDARVRQPAAVVTHTQMRARPDLRVAMIWREVLGPPVALRERHDSFSRD
jgi:hypothetical protein